MSHVVEDQQVNKVDQLSGTDRTGGSNKGLNFKFPFTVGHKAHFTDMLAMID